MSDSQHPTSLADEERSEAPPLLARARDAEVPSTVAAEPLKKSAFVSSFAGHAAMLLALVLLALWAAAPPPETVLKVTLLNDGPGAAGAAGGNGGSGPAAAASSAASAATGKTSTRAADATASPSAPPPASPPTPAEAAPRPPGPDQNAPVTVAAATPQEPLPPPPRRKPRPPRRARLAPAAAAPAAMPAPTPPQVAAAAAPAPLPATGEPGQGGSMGGGAGVGAGVEGAGHGVLGSGPIEGPGDDYLDRLRRWLNRYKHYPEAAQKAKQQGHLVVSFTILRDGTVIDPRVEQSSGFPLLDEAALKMLREASPVPALPDRYRAARLGVDLPVDFSLGLLHRLF